MLLSIDVGNTNTVFAVCNGEDIIVEWRLSTQARRTCDEYRFWLRQMMHDASLSASDITGAILATVVPETQFELTRLCERYLDVTALVVSSQTVRNVMVIDVDHPEEVGADRLVNAIQGWRDYNRGLVIIDFGTATTFDVINAKGAYVGGVIAPGVNLSLAALQQAAAKLPSIRIDVPQSVIGRNTITAMQSGIYHGYIGMITGVLQCIKQEQPEITMVIATGGLAALYAKAIPAIDATVDDLTIRGLISLYNLHNI